MWIGVYCLGTLVGAMEWLNGSQSADRHGLLPGFRIEEAQPRATPRPRFPTSRSQALSASEARKTSFMRQRQKRKSEISTFVRSISCFRLLTILYYSPQRRRICTPPDELSGAFVGKELIVFDRDRYVPFQSLDLVRFHGASELLDQGTAPALEFARSYTSVENKGTLLESISRVARSSNNYAPLSHKSIQLRYPVTARSTLTQ